ncbi:chemotaxis protein CheA [Anoxynatronum buryatiense]|uniref:Chemotaxis protein CheA n=1 Tax=Anoxynatronum buryatiense TaxID=489973 RepID=A0AA45WUN4_9CLOT|nr:chemotaxis protein CheA [Anoxynatronum buryatiense]SMP47400.1 two-component system, chemotaxis family, sensor kinase CheA [Anoxynatronum buryatiense]
MDVNQYLDMFIDESKEHLQHMNDILLTMEKNPQDTTHLNELFRIAHTIKGMSGTMGYNHVLSLTHQMENVLDQIRNGKLAVNGKVVDLLFECLDQLENYIVNIETTQQEGDNVSAELVKNLQLLENPQSPIKITETSSNAPADYQEAADGETDLEVDEYVASMIQKASDKGYQIFRLKISLNPKCMLKSARAYIIFSTLETMAEIIHANPSIEDIEDERFDFSFVLTVVTEKPEVSLIQELSNIAEVDEIIATELTVDNIRSQDDANHAPTEIAAAVMELDKGGMAESSKGDLDAKKKAKTGKTVRVDIDRLDNLMNLVSELIIIKTRLEDAHQMSQQKSISDTTEQLERITTSLHDAVMKVRMVPIERVFNRFPRMVRDLSKDLGKEINLQLTGEETEVDRTVIDEIGDPLIHLIRNAIDHGIEEPETRIRNHKDQAGTLKLIAYPDGNSVVIEVQDDGKGIDIERVKAKALDRGLISQSQSQLMEDKEVIQFLFHPGFSTADTVSDLSGRGVGLDVVKTKIETLGGVVEVDSQPMKGTRFIIRLPLTLAIIQALLVHVGVEKYAIPLNNIREISTIQESAIRKVQGKEVVLFRQSTLPVLRLSHLLSVPEENEKQEENTVVIVNHGDRTFGLVVDELIGQQEVVIKSLGRYLSGIQGIAGATILGNGTVALIVDTNSFF